MQVVRFGQTSLAAGRVDRSDSGITETAVTGSEHCRPAVRYSRTGYEKTTIIRFAHFTVSASFYLNFLPHFYCHCAFRSIKRLGAFSKKPLTSRKYRDLAEGPTDSGRRSRRKRNGSHFGLCHAYKAHE